MERKTCSKCNEKLALENKDYCKDCIEEYSGIFEATRLDGRNCNSCGKKLNKEEIDNCRGCLATVWASPPLYEGHIKLEEKEMITKETRENNEKLEDILNLIPRDLLMFTVSCIIESLYENSNQITADSVMARALDKIDGKEPYNGKWNVLEKYESIEEE